MKPNSKCARLKLINVHHDRMQFFLELNSSAKMWKTFETNGGFQNFFLHQISFPLKCHCMCAQPAIKSNCCLLNKKYKNIRTNYSVRHSRDMQSI